MKLPKPDMKATVLFCFSSMLDTTDTAIPQIPGKQRRELDPHKDRGHR